MWSFLKQNHFLLFELCIFIRMTAFFDAYIGQKMIIQDKVCLVLYGQNATFCEEIHIKVDNETIQKIKDDILVESAKFDTYINVLQTVPSITWTLFIGTFIDKFPNGPLILLINYFIVESIRVLVIILNTYFYTASPYYLLFFCVTHWFSGGWLCFVSAMYAFLTTQCDEKSRSLKYTLLSVFQSLGVGFGNFVGGQLLSPIGHQEGSPIRSYYHNFIAYQILNILAIILLFIVHKLNQRQKAQQQENPKDHDEPKESLIKILFNLTNIKSIFSCIFKSRPNSGRMHMYILFLIIIFQILVADGQNNIQFQFSQSAYQWDSRLFTVYNSIVNTASYILLGLATPLLVKVLKLTDGPLMWIAHASSISSFVVMGFYLSTVGYFIANAVGWLKWLALITLRSKLSKIVDQEEVGQVFSLYAILETLMEFVSSPVFAALFAVSISANVGLVYQVSAGLMVVSLGITLVESFCFRKTVEK